MRKNLIEYNITDFQGQENVFWSTGNNPTQLLNRINNVELEIHLKSLFLLADNIFGAASFFYESEITQQVTQKLKLLFDRGKIIYFINEDVENFNEHGIRKFEKSPRGLDSYSDKEQTRILSNTLAEFGHLLRRPSSSISDKIVELWIKDLQLAHIDSIGGKLLSFTQNKVHFNELKQKLIEISRTRNGQDFVWNYLHPKLMNLDFPTWLLVFTRARLSKIYSVATANLLGIPLDNQISFLSEPYITKKSKFDTSLFISCMEILGVIDSIKNISAKSLFELKNSSSFSNFFIFYSSLIESMEFNVHELQIWLPKYQQSEKSFKNKGITCSEFLVKFKNLCKILKKDSNNYSKPLDILLQTYDCFGIAPIEDFKASLNALAISQNATSSNDELLGVSNVKNGIYSEASSVDVVIITALDKELRAVIRHIGNTEEILTKNRTYYKATLDNEQGTESYSVIIISLQGMGNVQAGIATTQSISVWNPNKIFLVGLTGGVEDDEISWDSKWLGDILIAEQIVGYELAKIEAGKTIRRYQMLRPASDLLEAAQNLSTKKWVTAAKLSRPDGSSERVIPKVHFGVVASGEKVVADESFAEELKSDWSKLAGFEMESYGTALAAYQSDSAPGMLMIKGICDWADGNKNDEWQEYAADIAAAYVTELLKTTPFLPFEKPQAKRMAAYQPATFSGKEKIILFKRIGSDWKDLADYFSISRYHQDKFPKGEEMREIWHWLEVRKKLDELKEAFDFIERKDLSDIPGSNP